MSSRCNYCTLQILIHRFGRYNVRTRNSGSKIAPIYIEVKGRAGGRSEPITDWKAIAAFAALPDHCVCDGAEGRERAVLPLNILRRDNG